MSQPVTRFTSGQIQVSVWENEGKKGPYQSIRIGRRYKDPKTGDWKDSNSFFASELEALQDLLRQTAGFVGGKQEAGDAQQAGAGPRKRPADDF